MRTVKFNLSVFALLISFYVSAQSFQRQIQFPSTIFNYCRDVIQIPNGNYIAMGQCTGTIMGSAIAYAGINQQGDTIWTKFHKSVQNRWAIDQSVVRAPLFQDGSGYTQIINADTMGYCFFPVFVRFDYSGNILSQKRITVIDTGIHVVVQAICRSIDGALLMSGYQMDRFYNETKGLLIKTDINGNLIWRKTFSKAYPNVQYFKSIVQDPATKRIVIAGSQLEDSLTNYLQRGLVAIFDSVGTLISSYPYNNKQGGSFFDVISLSDGNFMTCGTENAYDDLDGWPRYFSQVTKFDKSGAIIWQKKFDQKSPYNSAKILHELPNGTVLVAGVLDTLRNRTTSSTTVSHNMIQIRLLVLNSNGDVVRRRYIGSARTPDSGEQPTSMRPTLDGGFVFSRELLDGSHIYVIPFSYMKIDNNLCDTTPAYCKMVDELGIVQQIAQSSNVIVFPNPASEKIKIIDSQNNFKREIIIYSATGDLVKQIEMDSDEGEVSIADLPNGIYILKIVQSNRIISTSKLSVEK